MVCTISVISKELKVDEDPGPDPTDFRSIKMVDYDFEFTPQKIPPTRVRSHFFCFQIQCASLRRKRKKEEEQEQKERVQKKMICILGDI